MSWQTKKLGELCNIQLGKTPARSNASYWDAQKKTGNVWLSIADLLDAENNIVFDSKEYLSDEGAKISKLIKKGTLLVSFKLTLGRLAFAGRDLFTNEAIAALTVFDEHRLLKEYLFYYLHFFDWAKAAENDVKIKGMTLNKAKLKEIPIRFPHISEQKRIVAILDEAFAGIEKAIANTEKNFANAHELFENTVINRIFGDPDKKGWKESPVEKLARPEKGSIRTGPFGSQLLHGEFADKGIAVLGIDNAVNNRFAWGRRRFITPEKYEDLKRYTVKPGDVLITIMGTCGRCAVVPENIPLSINSKHLCCISLDQEKCIPQFLHAYFLYHPVARLFLESHAKGSIMSGLNMEIIKKLPVRFPNLKEQRAIVESIETLSNETLQLERIYQQKLTALAELKQSLLQKAFSGELTAKESNKAKAAAA